MTDFDVLPTLRSLCLFLCVLQAPLWGSEELLKEEEIEADLQEADYAKQVQEKVNQRIQALKDDQKPNPGFVGKSVKAGLNYFKKLATKKARRYLITMEEWQKLESCEWVKNQKKLDDLKEKFQLNPLQNTQEEIQRLEMKILEFKIRQGLLIYYISKVVVPHDEVHTKFGYQEPVEDCTPLMAEMMWHFSHVGEKGPALPYVIGKLKSLLLLLQLTLGALFVYLALLIYGQVNALIGKPAAKPKNKKGGGAALKKKPKPLPQV